MPGSPRGPVTSVPARLRAHAGDFRRHPTAKSRVGPVARLTQRTLRPACETRADPLVMLLPPPAARARPSLERASPVTHPLSPTQRSLLGTRPPSPASTGHLLKLFSPPFCILKKSKKSIKSHHVLNCRIFLCPQICLTTTAISFLYSRLFPGNISESSILCTF